MLVINLYGKEVTSPAPLWCGGGWCVVLYSMKYTKDIAGMQ